MDLSAIHEWLMDLSAGYNVNPYIFAAIYIGAIPFFTISVTWILRNKRRKKPVTLPVLSTGFFLSSAYLYLLVTGENVPVWVYVMVVGLLSYGIYITYKKVTGKQNGVIV